MAATMIFVSCGPKNPDDDGGGGDAPINVESVALNETTATLVVGTTIDLEAEITPADATNKNVTWESDATAIATVADGTVTAVAPGTATITVTTEDGSKTATCEITVEAATVDVTGVELDTEKAHLITTDDEKNTLTLAASVLPADATEQGVTWSSEDETVATVVDGLITAVAPGTTTITVTTDDGDFTADCEITVTLHGFIIKDENITGTMGWEDAQLACTEGWRIPNGEELQCMCRSFHNEGGDNSIPTWPIDVPYWSSDTAQGMFGGETGARINFYSLSDPDCTISGAMFNSQAGYVRCIKDVE